MGRKKQTIIAVQNVKYKVSHLKPFQFTNCSNSWEFDFSKEVLVIQKRIDPIKTLNQLKNWGFFIAKIK